MADRQERYVQKTVLNIWSDVFSGWVYRRYFFFTQNIQRSLSVSSGSLQENYSQYL